MIRAPAIEDASDALLELPVSHAVNLRCPAQIWQPRNSAVR
ncbi:Uncharacterised protein [Mycobacterium tuberculosis]|uniref:Uncharacterized protein n=2 Tax=Mycobacterium tuberculosis TaxID=1773 RepID=Q8VJT2_MYCTO|nr:hypothetical protein MT2027 [Mycobacterium tuberculosis CDC1551]KDA14881.1 hypothetical protein CO60_1888 [Mycobacterium tuberculosis]BAQ06018.1 hypothetical protein KURONO_2222 [Mycobacterium tuberculosis str. Kurono]KQL74847.1 hypothetical protein HX92_1512 [Mycobacterium tuberculosis]KRT42984.1 hypothetical protein HX90_2099 [Mycobacterium tuberculosis]